MHNMSKPWRFLVGEGSQTVLSHTQAWLTALIAEAVWHPRSRNAVMRRDPDTNRNARRGEYIQFQFATQLAGARMGEREVLGVLHTGDVCCFSLVVLLFSRRKNILPLGKTARRNLLFFFPFVGLRSWRERGRGDCHHHQGRAWSSK